MAILFLSCTRVHHALAHGGTTYNSIIIYVQLLATLLFLCLYYTYLVISLPSLQSLSLYHVSRNYIHILCECAVLPLYNVLYIMYLPHQNLDITTSYQHSTVHIIRIEPYISELACSTRSTIYHS